MEFENRNLEKPVEFFMVFEEKDSSNNKIKKLVKVKA